MKNFISAAKDLNTVLGLDPAIKLDASEAVLKAKIKEAATLLTPDDILKEGTINTLTDLGVWINQEEEQPEEEPTEDEPTEDEPEIPEEEEPVGNAATELDPNLPDPNLPGLIKDTNSLKELRDLVKEYDEFKPLRGIIAKFKTVPVLKEEMLKLLKVVTAPAVEKTQKLPKVKGQRTKKAVVEEMISSANGATIEEIAKKIEEEGIDLDSKKNLVVVKLWLSKMGFDVKKDAIAKNPKFKK